MVSHDHVGRHIATISGNLLKYHIYYLHLISHPYRFAHVYVIVVLTLLSLFLSPLDSGGSVNCSSR